jgi:serine/threonine-protein kinase
MSHQEPESNQDADLGQEGDYIGSDACLQSTPSALPVAVVQTLVGQTLRNTYRITGVLEHGGMGTVYRGEQLRLRRPVAIKVLAQHLVAEPSAALRFRSEAEIISQLHHPHIVNILDFDATDAGDSYIVMEMLTGETLARRLNREHTLALKEVTEIVMQTAGGLLVAHAAGIVHRDLKPDNVFLLDMQDNSVFVKLLDFGISKRTAAHARVTREFEVLGTPDYMSPEQITNSAQADHRADQWSLAAIAYEMLAGRIPFYSETVGRTLAKVLHEDPPLLCDVAAGAPRALAEVVRRGLAKDPLDRYPSIMAFAEAFARAAEEVSTVQEPLAWGQEQGSQVMRRSLTPPLGAMRSSDTLVDAKPLSSQPAPTLRQSLESESRLPIPTVPVDTPPESSQWLPPNQAFDIRTAPTRPPSSSPVLVPRTTPPSVRAGVNSRLRRSDPPSILSLTDIPHQSLRPARVPRFGGAYDVEPRHMSSAPPTEPAPASDTLRPSSPVESTLQAQGDLDKLRDVLDEIRQAVTFGEDQRAFAKSRQAIQIARKVRQQESRDILAAAADLLRPILLRSLGGSQRRISVLPGAKCDEAVMSPEHVFLLSRVDGSATIEELLDTSPLPAAETLGILLDFRDQGCLGIE